ncbi:MAG: hypothetical protein WCY71_03490 [Halothiobacillaceae bacterium]
MHALATTTLKARTGSSGRPAHLLQHLHLSRFLGDAPSRFLQAQFGTEQLRTLAAKVYIPKEYPRSFFSR